MASSPEISDRIAELMRDLADQDAETRYLRSEVANLERAALLVSTPSVANASSYSRAALNSNHPNVTLTSNMSTGANVNNNTAFESCYDPNTTDTRRMMMVQAGILHPSHPTNGGAHLTKKNLMPEEFLDALSEKREGLIKARNDYVCAREERNRLEDVLQRNKANAEALASDLEKFYAKARWKPGAKHSYACPITTDNENSRLKKQLLEVYAEAQTTQKQMILQTEQLKELVNKIESLAHVDEEHFKAQTELKLRERELKAVEDEITSCKRIYQQKDKYLSRLSDTTKDLDRMRQIDAEKRVAQSALVTHKNHARQADASIRHRALLITLLEERIEIIGEAIRGDASPVNSDTSSSTHNQPNGNAAGHDPSDVPRVDVQHVDRVRNDIIKLQRQVDDNNHIIDVADSQIELGEERIRIIEKTIERTEEQLSARKQAHQDFNEVLATEVEEHRTEVVDKMTYYDSLNMKLREELAMLEDIIERNEAARQLDGNNSLARNSVSNGSLAAHHQGYSSSSVPATPPPPPPALDEDYSSSVPRGDYGEKLLGGPHHHLEEDRQNANEGGNDINHDGRHTVPTGGPSSTHTTPRERDDHGKTKAVGRRSSSSSHHQNQPTDHHYDHPLLHETTTPDAHARASTDIKDDGLQVVVTTTTTTATNTVVASTVIITSSSEANNEAVLKDKDTDTTSLRRSNSRRVSFLEGSADTCTNTSALADDMCTSKAAADSQIYETASDGVPGAAASSTVAPPTPLDSTANPSPIQTTKAELVEEDGPEHATGAADEKSANERPASLGSSRRGSEEVAARQPAVATPAPTLRRGSSSGNLIAKSATPRREETDANSGPPSIALEVSPVVEGVSAAAGEPSGGGKDTPLALGRSPSAGAGHVGQTEGAGGVGVVEVLTRESSSTAPGDHYVPQETDYTDVDEEADSAVGSAYQTMGNFRAFVSYPPSHSSVQ